MCLIVIVPADVLQIIAGDHENPGQHTTHVRGIAALLSNHRSPFDMIAGVELFQLHNPLLLKEPLKVSTATRKRLRGGQSLMESHEKVHGCGLLCAPVSNGSVESLDSILIQFHSVFHRARDAFTFADAISNESFTDILNEAVELEDTYAQWAASQIEEWKPTTMNHSGFRLSDSDVYCPGRIDTYFDCTCRPEICCAFELTIPDYVAAVWNTYRKSRLLILEVIVRCKTILAGADSAQDEVAKARVLVDDMIASIPYQLSPEGLSACLKPERDTPTILPGKPIGGMLLLHPLWVVSITSIVPSEIRTRMRQCLAWIGRTMGIGQATLLSRVRSATILLR